MIGSETKFKEMLFNKYGISSDLPWDDYITLSHQASILHQQSTATQAQLKPVYSLLVPPHQSWRRLAIAQEIASRFNLHLVSGSAAVRTRSTEYPPIWGMPSHHSSKGITSPAFEDNDFDTVEGNVEPTAATMRYHWAAEGIAEELQLMKENKDKSAGALLINAPRDAKQLELLDAHDCVLKGVIAIDGSAKGDVPLDVAEKWSDFKSWGRALIHSAEKTRKKVVYVTNLTEESSLNEIVDRIASALKSLQENK